MAADDRLRWAGICVAVALAGGMLLSPGLWLTRPQGGTLAQSFPMVAPLAGLGVLAPPAPLDSMLYIGTLVLCALAAVVPRRTVFTVLFLACVLLALPDMLRWQPWFYLYLGAIGALAFVPQGAPGRHTRGRVGRLEPLRVFRLMTACVYLYSGLNKLNAAFLEERLSGFLAGMPPVVGEGPLAAALTYSAPFVEVAAGLGLLLGGYRVRHAALALAASTNLFVLVALVPAGANIVVWPWDVAMIALVGILFAGRDENEQLVRRGSRRGAKLLPGHLYAVAVIALFAVMPAFGLLGYWPSYLSFALYSENTPEASIAVDGRLTTVTTLSYESLNVPAYPAPEVYEAVGDRACSNRNPEADDSSHGPILGTRSRPDILDGGRAAREYTCAELRREEKDPGTTNRPG